MKSSQEEEEEVEQKKKKKEEKQTRKLEKKMVMADLKRIPRPRLMQQKGKGRKNTPNQWHLRSFNYEKQTELVIK